jgi:hypothetical protein
VGQRNVDAFIAQANEYATTNEGLDVIYKPLATLGLTHPMSTVRAGGAAALGRIGRLRAHRAGRVAPIAAPRRASGRLKDDLAAAGRHYAAGARDVASQVADAAKGVADGWERRFGRPRSRDLLSRRRWRAGTRIMLGPPPRKPGRDHLLRAREPRYC